MKSLFSLSLFLLFSSVFGQVLSDSGNEPGEAAIQPRTGRFIVKFSGYGSKKFKKRDGTADTGAFYTTLQSTGQSAEPALSFDSSVFHGASFDLTGATNKTLEEIRALPEVEKVWEAGLFTLPVEASSFTPGGNVVWNPHNDTNVNLLHSLGYDGKDVIVAIVDSGVDYTHPSLGGGFGPGYKIDKGYDLVGDEYDVGLPYVPDDDPFDCHGHGTHVSGIVGSNYELVPGVAPGATLRMYKVFGCSGSAYEDVIVAGMLQAYEEGADIISASLGSNAGFAETAFAMVATSIHEAGRLVTISAGNAGETGPFYTSSGGNGYGSLAIGSVSHKNYTGAYTVAHSSSGESREILYLSSDQREFALEGNHSAYWVEGTRDLSCTLPDSASPSSDDIVILPRGSCVWQIMDTVLIGRVNWVFYYNFEGSEWEVPDRSLYRDDQATGFALITYEDGQWLLEQHEQNFTVTYEFVHDYVPVALPKAAGSGAGGISYFSSFGPTLDARMKPEISAPAGGTIFSTWPVSQGSYATYSGTSMACPYIAGVGALFFQSRGGRRALGDEAANIARERIIASGDFVIASDGTENLASVAQQGAGLIDAFKVVEYTTTVSPPVLHLNDTDHFQSFHSVVISNQRDEAVTYQVVHQPGVTILSKGAGDAWVSRSPSYTSGEGNVAEATLSAETITVGAGGTATLSIIFVEPPLPAANTLPVYGGGILLVGDNGEMVKVTYMGVKGSIYASDTWEMQRDVPLMLSGYGGLVEEGHNYTFEDNTDIPQPYFNILWSTRELSIDLVERDWNETDWAYPFVPGLNKWVGSVRTRPSGLSDEIIDFPLYLYPRVADSSFTIVSSSVLANGTEIPSGQFKLLARALRTFGDRNNPNDWQIKTSPWFNILRDRDNPTITSSTTSTTTMSSTTTTTTTTTTAPASCEVTPLILQATMEGETYELYRFSDFLGMDLAGTNTNLDFALTGENYLQITTPGQSTVYYAAAHSNSNSLVYVYTASRVSGAWSHLVCQLQGGELVCTTGDKTELYYCGTSDGLLRHGPAIVDGCTSVTLGATANPDPRCGTSTSTTLTTLSTSSSTVLATTTTNPATSTMTTTTSASVMTTSTLAVISTTMFASTVSSTSQSSTTTYSTSSRVTSLATTESSTSSTALISTSTSTSTSDNPTSLTTASTSIISSLSAYTASGLPSSASLTSSTVSTLSSSILSSTLSSTGGSTPASPTTSGSTGTTTTFAGTSSIMGSSSAPATTSATSETSSQSTAGGISSSSTLATTTTSSNTGFHAIPSITSASSTGVTSSADAPVSSSTTTSHGVGVGPIGGTTSASSTGVTSATDVPVSSTTTSYIVSVGPIEGTTRSTLSTIHTSPVSETSTAASASATTSVPGTTSGSYTTWPAGSVSSSTMTSVTKTDDSLGLWNDWWSASTPSGGRIDSSPTSRVTDYLPSWDDWASTTSPFTDSLTGPLETGKPWPTSQKWTTSTIYTTTLTTITACPTTIPRCPVVSQTTTVSTIVISVTTTVCPVTLTSDILTATVSIGPAPTTGSEGESSNKWKEWSSVSVSTRTVTSPEVSSTAIESVPSAASTNANPAKSGETAAGSSKTVTVTNVAGIVTSANSHQSENAVVTSVVISPVLQNTVTSSKASGTSWATKTVAEIGTGTGTASRTGDMAQYTGAASQENVSSLVVGIISMMVVVAITW
ncbi:hypothetical protein A1O1_05698 [Capronia coronata CBS 617.96]|uniref:Peptidase S8/S53 domain-containing protein n=1 Tax=Capronia coronata CBS 617.96 TaxID=1182541 RepID=W9YSU8_9EURO|nr:uncharacterized protein A1O1_05698 [Capronia coronata CBS 617.96]EXJ85334.1 hypothetical protein A1O1_05698 [Capronia coronata CBS 617.96]